VLRYWNAVDEEMFSGMGLRECDMAWVFEMANLFNRSSWVSGFLAGCTHLTSGIVSLFLIADWILCCEFLYCREDD
jgi:hypothetical protein